VTRSIPAQYAPVVEALELDGAVVVTTEELRGLLHDAGVATEATVAIARLAEHGWLLPTGVRGAWEFAPGSHAGPFSHGDPFLTLQAQLAVTPDVDARVGLASALWLAGLVDRTPDRHVVTLGKGMRVPAALKRTYNATTFNAATAPDRVRGVPVCSPATVLVHLAESPTAVANWGLVLDGLGGLVDVADRDALRIELAGRTNATLARLAYLLFPFDPDFVETSIDLADHGVVWFGPRRTLRRTDSRWNIADTILPRSPTEAAETSHR
jgi:hypothetical protein